MQTACGAFLPIISHIDSISPLPFPLLKDEPMLGTKPISKGVYTRFKRGIDLGNPKQSKRVVRCCGSELGTTEVLIDHHGPPLSNPHKPNNGVFVPLYLHLFEYLQQVGDAQSVKEEAKKGKLESGIPATGRRCLELVWFFNGSGIVITPSLRPHHR